MIVLINALKIIFLLGFLIFIHESGHFIVAKMCKVKVNEFALGFGPTIWKKQTKETKYALRLIPLGGFVNMEGEEERSENEGSFSTKSVPKRIAIVLAGGLVNIVFGILVYFILVTCQGGYKVKTVDKLTEGFGAEVAGIQVGDEICKVNGKKVRVASDISKLLINNQGKTIEVVVKRNSQELTLYVTPTLEDGVYYLGLELQPAENNIFSNIYYGFWDTVGFSTSIIDSLKMMFTGKVTTDQLMGPVGISQVVTKTEGIANYLFMFALISLSLGVTNLLPFPPLDGGKIVFLIIEGIRKKPISQNIEIGVQMIGFMLLIGLSIFVTYNDIIRIF